MDNLPPPNTTRWVTRRKAAVVAAVRNSKITIEEALRRYQLTEEEFLSWQRAFEVHGLAGLRAHPHPTIPLAASSPIAAEYPLDVMPLFIVGVVGLQRHLPGFARDRRAPRNPSTASAAPPASRSSGRSDIRMHFGPADQHIVKPRSPAR